MICQKEIKSHCPCPCGSGKHLQDCHWNEVKGLHEEHMYYLEQYGWIINKEQKITKG